MLNVFPLRRIAADMDLTRYLNTPNFLATYPIHKVDQLLLVPDERRGAASALTNTVGTIHIIEGLILLNAAVRRLIAYILNANQARSIFYYFLDTFRVMHGITSELTLQNAGEYVFRYVLSVFSLFYSSTLSTLFMQFVYDQNKPVFGSVANVARAALPVFCEQFSSNCSVAVRLYESDCMQSFGIGGSIRVQNE